MGWPLVALLTRPVRVYLTVLALATGDADRCILLSVDVLRLCGLCSDVSPGLELDDSLSVSGGPVSSAVELLRAGTPLSCCDKADGFWSGDISESMSGARQVIMSQELGPKADATPLRSRPK